MSQHNWVAAWSCGMIGPMALSAGILTAQTPAEPEPKEKDKPAAERLTLPSDAAARKGLDEAEDLVKKASWQAAAEILHNLLNRKVDSFVDAKSTDPDGRTVRKWVSVRAEAVRLLDSLPPAGRVAYAKLFGAKAEMELADAKRGKTTEPLADVVRRYPHTEAGAEAADLLATQYAKDDQPELALRYLEFLIDRSGGKPTPTVLFRAALAARRASNAESSKTIEKTLLAGIPKAGQRINDRVLTVEEVRKELDAVKPLPAVPPTDWPMFRGDARRGAAGRGDVPFLDEANEKWVQGMIRREQTKLWVDQAVKFQARQQAPILPAFFPIAGNGMVVFRSYYGVHGVDLRRGKLVWEQDSDLSIDSLVNPQRGGGKIFQLNQWVPMYQAAGHLSVLYENSTVGTLGMAGKRVFFIDDLALPPHPHFLANFAWGGVPGFGPLEDAINSNRLVVLDADSGKRVWQSGGLGEKDAFAQAFFLGVPLPLGGKLYVLTEKKSELKLVCLDGSDYSVTWSLVLGDVRDPIGRDVGRRIQSVNLSYGDGILVVPTNAGAVFGVDLLTRSPVWVHSYQKPPAPVPLPVGRRPLPLQLGGNVISDWKFAAPIVHGGRVVFTAPDGSSIRCLNLRDGALAWEAERQDDLYLAGVFKNNVVLVGNGTCRALSLVDGKQRWVLATGVPSGLGVASEGAYFLPLQAGAVSKQPEICVIDLDKGTIRSHVRSRRNEVPGNLLLYQDRVMSQTVRELTAYPELRGKLARIDAQVKLNPRDPAALIERADVRFWRGDAKGAAEDLLTALDGKPNDALRAAARERAHEVLTEVLRGDFDANEKYLERYKELCTVPVAQEQQRRRAGFAAVVAVGRERQGKLEEALGHYLDFSQLEKSAALLASPDEPAVRVRPDVWAGGRIAAMIARSPAEQRKPLEDAIARRWQVVREGKKIDELRNFVTVFGSLSAAGPDARLLLAERLVEQNDLLAAELQLLQVRRAPDAALAGRAVDALARLMVRSDRMEDAAHWYRILGRDFARTVVRDKKTGAGILQAFSDDKRLLPYLGEPASPWQGKIKVKEEFGQFGQDPQVHHFEPEGEVTPYLARNRLCYQMNVPRIKLIDDLTGEERWSLEVTRPNQNHLQYLSWNLYNHPDPTPVRFTYQLQGRLAVFRLGLMVYGIDLAARKILWERNLLGKDVFPIVQLTPDPQGSLNATYPDNRSEAIGRPHCFGPDCVLLQTRQGLQSVDPLLGSVRWERADVPVTARLAGDGENVFWIDPGKDGAPSRTGALRARDGAAVKVAEFSAAYAHQVRTLGGRLLVAEKGPKEETVLRLYDLLGGKDVWRQPLPKGTRVLQTDENDLVGVIDPEGKLSIRDVSNGRESYSCQLELKEIDKAQTITLLADRERFYVAVSRPPSPHANLWGGPWSSLVNVSRILPVNGRVFGINRTTGKKWRLDVEEQILVLDHFGDLPILLFTVRSQKLKNLAVVQGTSTLSVDKRTGKVLYDKTMPNNNTNFHTFRIDVGARTIDLIGYNLKIRHSVE